CPRAWALPAPAPAGGVPAWHFQRLSAHAAAGHHDLLAEQGGGRQEDHRLRGGADDALYAQVPVVSAYRPAAPAGAGWPARPAAQLAVPCRAALDGRALAAWPQRSGDRAWPLCH